MFFSGEISTGVPSRNQNIQFMHANRVNWSLSEPPVIVFDCTSRTPKVMNLPHAELQLAMALPVVLIFFQHVEDI